MEARPDWHRVDFISDLHLQTSEPDTASAFLDYLAAGDFDALFILGDLFEVWIGDDVLLADPTHPDHHFPHTVVSALRRASAHASLFFMHGNRDFLVGQAFAQASGMTLLPDPCVLQRGVHRWLLSHGDAWCLEDRDYLRFRDTVRQPDWQARFLAQPLPQRDAIARELRMQSQQHQQTILDRGRPFADVDATLALEWLTRTRCSQLIHGHTHRPGWHVLAEGYARIVLSDWDANAHPPRLETLSLLADDQLVRLPIQP